MSSWVHLYLSSLGGRPHKAKGLPTTNLEMGRFILMLNINYKHCLETISMNMMSTSELDQ